MTKGIEGKKCIIFSSSYALCENRKSCSHLSVVFLSPWSSLLCRKKRDKRARDCTNTRNMRTRWEICSYSVTQTSGSCSSCRWSSTRSHSHSIFLCLCFKLHFYGAPEYWVLNTHNHVIHLSILPSIFLTTHLTLGHRKLIPAVIGWKTGCFLCRLQYNHIKNIYSLKNNNLWHSNSTGFSSFSTYFF